MNWLRRLASRLSSEQRSYPPNWLARLFDEWATTNSGENVTAETALKFSAFYSAVDLISRAMGQLPLVLMRNLGHDGQERAYNHPTYELLHTRPNPEQTAFTWRQTMQSWVLRYGNAYAEVERNGTGRPSALWPIPSNEMELSRNSADELVYTQRHGGIITGTWSADEIVHIRTLGDGLTGKSPVRLFAEGVGLALAAEHAGAAFFRNGMRASGVMEHPGVLSDNAAKHLLESKTSTNSGADNFGKLLLFEEGMKWNQLTIPPDDAQFLETRVYQVRDVARIFHVPLHKLGDLERATFSNIEEQNIEWVIDCLGPWVVNWEQELSYKLLLPGERAKYNAQFVLEGLLRGNSQARAQFYTSMFNIGVFSINEIRKLENQNPIGDEGDVHYVPLNMTTAKLAAEGPPPKPDTQAAPTAPDEPDMPMMDKQMATAHRELLLDTAGRLVRMEANAARKALRRPERFRSTLDDLLGNAHELHAIRILLPASTVCWAASGRNGDHPPLSGYLAAFVREHIAELRAQLSSARDPASEILMWERNAPSRIADRILSELAKER